MTRDAIGRTAWKRFRDGVTAGGLAWLCLSMLGVTGAFKIAGADWLWVAVAAGGMLGALGFEAWFQRLAVAALVALLAVSYAPGPVGRLSRGLVVNDPIPGEPVDAVVVLAGSVSPDGRVGTHAVDRLLEGFRLAKLGVAPRVVTSRVRVSYGADSISSDADLSYLATVAGEIPMTVLDRVGTTRLEAERFQALATASGWSTIVVVTSPSHTRRACGTYARLGLRVICRASPDRSAAIETLPRPHDRLAAFSDWLYESLAMVWYRYRGWL